MSNKGTLRAAVRGAYDLQKLRIQIGNRIVGNFKACALGQNPGMSETDLDKEANDILKKCAWITRRLWTG